MNNLSVENSILFDDENKAFSICDGSIGIYRYEDVVKGQIVYEHAKYKGKSPMFSHRVLVSTLNASIFVEMKKVYVGVEITLLNGERVYVYISKGPVIQHNYQFKEDYKVAKQIVEKMDKRKKEE